MRALLALVVVAACGTTSSPSQPVATSGAAATGVATPSTATASAPTACDPAVPAAACKQQGGLRTCKEGDPARVGEWRFAIIVPSYASVEDVATDKLAALWKAEPGATIQLAATTETRAALAVVLGPGKLATLEPGARPTIDDKHWAIVPADELVPNWKVITVDGKHPLDAAPGPLAVPLCGADKQLAVRNIDPARLTTLAMTGTTALTRYVAKLMDDKGILYPLPSVEPWLKSVDFVHISNEVSFVPKCDAGSKPTMSFCSKESYIELLEKSHTKIVELTGSHLHDYGRDWIDHTIAMYEKRGWIWFGGGRNQVEATAPRLLEHKGNKLAFLGCNMPHTDNKVISSGSGVAACDLARLGWQIRDLKKRGYVPIVSVQHDEVYKHDPPHGLVQDLRQIADAGPAFVMGSQAHCPHPWEVHRGAYVHYGPGNFYFDQFWHPVRDAAQDKLYIHDGKLLTVGHLYTRIEERGRPRVLNDSERAEFLVDLGEAQTRLPRGAEPWAAPVDVPESRERPDSILVKGVVERIVVKVPAKLEDGKQYALVIELGGPAVANSDAAFVVTPASRKHTKAPKPSAAKLGEGITALMTAKYPIDPEQITVNVPVAKPRGKPKRSK